MSYIPSLKMCFQLNVDLIDSLLSYPVILCPYDIVGGGGRSLSRCLLNVRKKRMNVFFFYEGKFDYLLTPKPF